MPEPIRRERKSRSGSVLASMNPRTMSMRKKQEEDNTVERIEVPYLCPIVLRKEVIYILFTSSLPQLEFCHIRGKKSPLKITEEECKLAPYLPDLSEPKFLTFTFVP